jgi:hypothetical protein
MEGAWRDVTQIALYTARLDAADMDDWGWGCGGRMLRQEQPWMSFGSHVLLRGAVVMRHA